MTPNPAIDPLTARLDRLEQLLEAPDVTPAPWFNDYGKVGHGEVGHGESGIGEMDCTADGALIVELRNMGADLAHVARAAQKWQAAYEATGRCRDEFGWGEDGASACAQWQEAENEAADTLMAALAALTEETP